MLKLIFYFNFLLLPLFLLSCASTSTETIEIESVDVIGNSYFRVKGSNLFSNFDKNKFKLGLNCLSCEQDISVAACSDLNCTTVSNTVSSSGAQYLKVSLTSTTTLASGTYYLNMGEGALELNPTDLESAATALLTAGLSSGDTKESSATLYQTSL